MNIKEYLTTTKNLLVDVGWVKGAYVKYEPGGAKVQGFCLLGALSNIGVTGNMETYYAAANLITTRLMDRTGHQTIPGFNDAESTTKEDVIALLDDLIKEQPNE